MVWILACLTACTACQERAQPSKPLKITVYSRDDHNAKHAISLIKLAAEEANIKLQLNVIFREESAKSLRQALLKGDIDLIWTATSRSLQERFKPVKIPLYRGLLGYRLCMINDHNRDLLKGVKSMEALKPLTFGLGEGWSDIGVFQSAGLKVKIMDYEQLFQAVHNRTIDCAPRAIFEAFPEQYNQRYRYLYKLYVDRYLMIRYIMPFYFFTRKDDDITFNLLHQGLTKAIMNGRYQNAVKKNPSLRMAIRKIQRNKRRVITIPNALLPDDVPKDPHFWFDMHAYNNKE